MIKLIKPSITFKSVEDDEDDKILEKLKDKNLSSKDLKNLYDEIKRKKN